MLCSYQREDEKVVGGGGGFPAWSRRGFLHSQVGGYDEKSDAELPLLNYDDSLQTTPKIDNGSLAACCS